MTISEISVVLPLRNVAPWLQECLDSLRAQTYKNFEVVAIDDHSTDATSEIFARVSAMDSRFVLHAAAGKGLVDALNQAVRLSSSPWLARMDGDDICDPRRFERQVQMARANPHLSVLGTGVRIFPRPLRSGMDRYETWLNGVLKSEQIFAQRFVESPLAHPSVLMNREAFDSVGGYVDRGWPEDYDLWLRLLAAGRSIAKSPEILLGWRDHGARTSRVAPQYSPDSFRRCKLHYLRQSHLLDGGCVVLGAGPVGKAWAKLLWGNGIPVLAFIDVHPGRIGRRIQGSPVRPYSEVAELGDAILLAAVGKEGAREEIFEHFRRHPLRPGQMLIPVA